MNYIVAFDKQRGIGLNNKLPWKITNDIKRFKELTIECNVIMGMSTFLSIPENFRPLKHRLNIVLTKKKILSNDDILKYTDYDSIDEILSQSKYKKINY
jgi:dihydrofolate reductase